MAALVTQFGGGFPAGLLWANDGADNVVGDPFHQVWRRSPGLKDANRRQHRQHPWRPWFTKCGGVLPAGMMRADGGAENVVGGPCHQVWRMAPWRDGSDRGSPLGCCRPAATQILQ